MKTSEALKRVKQFLWDGKQNLYLTGCSMHICNAIADAQYMGKISLDHREMLQDLIAKRMNNGTLRRQMRTKFSFYSGVTSLEHWLLYIAKINWVDECEAARANVDQQMQAYRHRWVDALIKEFKEKGD